MKTITLAVAASLLLAGCVTHTWAPPPGGTDVTFDQQSAQCRLFARGITPSGGFVAASGKPAFVGAFVGGALIGSAIGTAVATQNNFNDCMSASGWQIVDHQAPALSGPQPRVFGTAAWDVAAANCKEEAHQSSGEEQTFANEFDKCMKQMNAR